MVSPSLPSPSAASAPTAQELVFIFDDLPNWQDLAAGAREGLEVVVLDATRDGLAQMAQFLEGKDGIGAIHILSHGEPGQVQLGSLSLGSAEIAGHADTLARIGQALTPGGDILLYGCNTAAGDTGTAFVAALAAATSADVAASIDLTGSAALGGNWVLEKHQGDVQAGLALSGPTLVRYSGVLATPASENFESYPQEGSGVPTSPRTDLGDFQYGLNGTNPASYVLDAMFGFGYLTGQVLALNFDSLNGITRFTLQAASLANNFTLQSLKLEVAGGPATTASTTFIVKGYDGGSGGQLLMTETVNLLASDALGTITYVKDINYPGGQLAFNSAWGNVDTLVFEAVGGDGINMGIDDIVVSAAVPDTVPPAFSSATVNGSALVMTYTEASMLDASNPPSAISFTVMAGGSPVTVNSVVVNATAKTVTLTLAAPVIGGQAVTVAYTDPTGGNDANAIQDTAGNDAITLTATAVTNNTPDTTPPAFASAAVNGNSLVMTYTEASTLDAVNKPGTNAFTVTAGGSGVGVSSVAVDANAKTVTLTLASAVANGQAVTVAYTDPTGGNDASAIQDAAGNDAITLTATAVINNTPDTTAPTITSIVRQTPAAATTNADTLVYRVSFSEDVTNVATSAFTVVGATDAMVTKVSTVSAQTYDVTVAEGDIASLNGTVALTVHSGPTIRDLANNTLGSFTPTGADESYTLDNTAPTVSIGSNTAQLKAGQTANISFTFSEDPGSTFTWDGSTGDVSVIGGTLSAIAGSGLTRTATFTPTAGTDASTASITVGAGSYQDAAGNNGGAGTTPTLAFDTKAPTVVSIDRQTPISGTTNADSLVYRVTFSEAVNDVLSSGFDVTGGSNAFVTHVQSVGGNAWDITVAEGNIANHNGPVTLAFSAGQAVKDSAGNALASTTPSGTHNPTYTLDNTAPTLAITSNRTSLPVGNTATITFTFSEDPGASFTWDGTVGDVVVTGGTLGAISGTGLTRTATFTPTANTNSSTASITVAAGTYTDAAGNNGGAGTTPSITFDTQAPVLASSTPADNATGVGPSNNLVLTFAENVTAAEGYVTVRKTSDNSLVEQFDVATGEGSLGGTVAVAGSSLTLNPHNDLAGDTGYYVLAEFGIVRDGLGNYFGGIAGPLDLNFTTGSAPVGGGGGGGGTPAATTVDGTPVTTTTAPNGSTTTTVPVVAPSRTDTPGSASTLADIPLVRDAGSGQSLLQVGVPTGVGFAAEGPATGVAAQTELIQRIEKLAGTGTELGPQAELFLSTLGASTPLTVQTITPTAGAGFNPGTPLVITGGAGSQAVVVDARALPSGTVIQVDNVEFVAIVGAVRVIGGTGQNAATGDGAAQWIVLGPDDDVIHGGGGNDTVGSEAGDDQVYGDAGDDIVFGGAGNDQLSGGTGSDRLNGGTGFDVAIQEGARTDYTVTLEGAGIKLTHTASGVSDWLVDVEQVRFATGPSLTVAHSAAEEAGAYLFQKWLGRDLTQGEGAIIQTLAGQSAEQVATLFAQLFPTQTAGKTAAQLLDGMAGAGAIRVDAVRDVLVNGDAANNTISPTLGLARYVDGGAGTDTVVIPATLAQTHIQANANGSFTLQRMTDGAMLDVTRVERVSFSDTKLALDLNGNAGQAAKLLGALAGPAMLANKGVVGEVIRLLDAGATSQTIAGLGLQLLGASTPTQIAQTLWTSITGRAGTSGELKILTDIMAGGTSAADLVVMAANLDATAVRIDLVGLAARGIEFA